MATTSSSWTRFMLLQPLTQPTRAEYQTWPRMRARSLMSRRLGLADGPGDDALHQHRHLLLALDGGRVGRGQGGEHGADQLGLAAHGPQGPVEGVDDPFRRRVALGRALGQPAVELLDPVDEGGGQQVVLAGEVPVDRAHGHVGPGGHVTHLDGLVAAVEGQRHGGVDDPLAPGLLGPRQGAWHRTVHHGEHPSRTPFPGPGNGRPQATGSRRSPVRRPAIAVSPSAASAPRYDGPPCPPPSPPRTTRS